VSTLNTPLSSPPHSDNYKWIALSNTTLGILLATINGSILLIALPDIFRGIHLNPLASSNTPYFLWILTGFLLVTSVLVVSFGRVGTSSGGCGCSLWVSPSSRCSRSYCRDVAHGHEWCAVDHCDARRSRSGWRLLVRQLHAILTDAFPANERGLALGINGVAAIGGSFMGLVIGGVLAPIEWHLVFLVSVPVSLLEPSGRTTNFTTTVHGPLRRSTGRATSPSPLDSSPS